LRRVFVKIEASLRRLAKDRLNAFRGWLALSLGSQLRLMTSPPSLDPIPSLLLAPGEASIDVEHLARMTLGDGALRREVLAMFLRQTGELLGALAVHPAEGAALAHTLKGSARAIGAFHVAACAERLEAAIRQGGNPSEARAALEAAVAEASCSIEAILARP